MNQGESAPTTDLDDVGVVTDAGAAFGGLDAPVKHGLHMRASRLLDRLGRNLVLQPHLVLQRLQLCQRRPVRLKLAIDL